MAQTGLNARRALILAVLGALLVVLAVPAAAVTTVGPGVNAVIKATNDYRVSQSVSRLTHHPRLTDMAQRWANQMVADVNAGVDKYDALRHNPNLGAEVAAATGGASQWGENIAYNNNASNPYGTLVNSWITSERGHRENMIRSTYTHIGVGVARANNGLFYGVQVFARTGPSNPPAPGSLSVAVDTSDTTGLAAQGCVELLRREGATFTGFADYCVPVVSPTTTVLFSDIPPGTYTVRVHDFVPDASIYLGGSAEPGTTVTVSSAATASVNVPAAVEGSFSLTMTRAGESQTGAFCYTILSPSGSTADSDCVSSASSHVVELDGYVGVKYTARLTSHAAVPTQYYRGATCQQNALPLTPGAGGGNSYTWDFGQPWSCLTDVLPATPFFEEIIALQHSGVATGYDNGTYQPSQPVTRQAMAAFLYRVAGEPSFTAPTVAEFSDVPLGHPFFHEISWMAHTGLSTGYDGGTFRPSAAISRQAMAAFLYRLSEETAAAPTSAPFADVSAGHQFATEIKWMADSGISTGYANGTFRPTATVTRLAMAPFLVRYMASYTP